MKRVFKVKAMLKKVLGFVGKRAKPVWFFIGLSNSGCKDIADIEHKATVPQERFGILLAAHMPRWFPWLRRVAAATAFVFAMTSILPAGYANETSYFDTLRPISPEEAPNKTGLEEALQKEKESAAQPEQDTMTRRAFLKGTAAAIGASVLELVPEDQLKAQSIPFKTRKEFLDFIGPRKITGIEPIMPPNVPKERLDEARRRYRELTGLEFKGFEFNGLYREYEPGDRDEMLTRHGRIWPYGNALVLMALVALGEKESARELMDALVRLGKAEEALGFQGGYHFSYNSQGERLVDGEVQRDSFIHPMGPTGNALWVVGALYAAMRQLGDWRHLEWVNALRRRLFEDIQIRDAKDLRYGLLPGGRYTDLTGRINPKTQKPFPSVGDRNFIDEVGYRVYEGDPNRLLEDVAKEHLDDAVWVAWQAYLANEAAPTYHKGRWNAQEKGRFLESYRLLVNNLARLWVGDHPVTGIESDPSAGAERRLRLNESVATDNGAWGWAMLAYNEEMAWQAIQFIRRNFRVGLKVGELVGLPTDTKEAIRDGRIDPEAEVVGTSFWQESFMDSFVGLLVPLSDERRAAWKRMIHPEATLGVVHFLNLYARRTTNDERRRQAQAFSDELWHGMIQLRELYGGKLPNAVWRDQDPAPPLFTLLSNITSSSWMILVAAESVLPESVLPVRDPSKDLPDELKSGIRFESPRAGLEDGNKKRWTTLMGAWVALFFALANPSWSQSPQPGEKAGAALPPSYIVANPADKRYPANAEVNASQLPLRVISERPEQPLQPGPGAVVTLNIKPSKEPADPIQVEASQIGASRYLATPAYFTRDVPETVQARTENFLSRIMNTGRRMVYEVENPETWIASSNPLQALILPNARMGYTLWHPERLSHLGEDSVKALFQSLGQGAKKIGSKRPAILYETNWTVTLKGAQNEKPPVSEAVLEKFHRHAQLARENEVQLVALYSGSEGLTDPDTAIQHLNIAMVQGFDPTVIVTDVEPQKGPRWREAIDLLRQAKAKGDSQAISKANRHLLMEASRWLTFHERILKDVIPAVQPHGGPTPPTQVHAFVNPAFVPLLRNAVLWRNLEREANAKGYDSNRIWSIFEEVWLGSEQLLRVEDLVKRLTQEGFNVDANKITPQLPQNLKPIVMAYAYPNGQEADSVAHLMRIAYADGFGSSMGLAVNLEPETGSVSLATRSERAGEIVQGTLKTLRGDSTTGFDGKTVYVHVADEFGLVDMFRIGRLTPQRALTSERIQPVSDFAHDAAVRLFGITPRRIDERHRIPVEETAREFAERQVVNILWGLGAGPVGAEPGGAFFENLHTWIVKGVPAVHPGSGPFGPELGGSIKFAKLAIGVLGSGHAQITDVHLHLVKRDKRGEVVRKLTVRHILGKNSPIISDDVWDEAELEVRVRRVGNASPFAPRLLVDMAAKVENRYSAPGETPREEWQRISLPFQKDEDTITVKLPKLVAGANSITLLTHDNQGRIVEWLGSSQNPQYLTPYAPSIVETAQKQRLPTAKEEVRRQLGLQSDEPLTIQHLLRANREGRLDNPIQRALVLNRLSLMAGTQAEVMVWVDMADPQTYPANLRQILTDLKLMGITSVAIRMPTVESEAGRRASFERFFASEQLGELRTDPFLRLKESIRLIHEHGLKAYLVLEGDELSQTSQGSNAALGELLRSVVEANGRGGWNIDGIALHQPRSNSEQRAVVERILRNGLDVAMVVIGPQGGTTSEASLYVHTVSVQDNPTDVLSQVEQILKQPQQHSPREHRFNQAVILTGRSLSELVQWMSQLPIVASDEALEKMLLSQLIIPNRATLERLGYPPNVVDQVLQRNYTELTQEKFTQDLQAREEGAIAIAEGMAAQLKDISETSQVEHYGSVVENAALSFYEIHPLPLILTGVHRAEVMPLVSKHLVQKDGKVLLGVQVTNPSNPDRVTSPAVYDVWVHLDYPSWLRRPEAVHHRAKELVLQPGETAPVWIQLEGLPENEDPLVASIRVVPRDAETFRPGRPSTRNREQQALEMVGFRIHRHQPTDHGAPISSFFLEEIGAFEEWYANWKAANGIDPRDDSHREQLARAYFGVGTPLARAEVSPKGAEILPLPTDPMAAGAQAVEQVRKELENRKTELMGRVEQEPGRIGLRFLSWIYTIAAKTGIVLGAVVFVLGAIGWYLRAGTTSRYRQQLQEKATHVRVDSANPAGLEESTQRFNVLKEETVRVTGWAAKFQSSPAVIDPEQGKVHRSLSAFDKHEVIVASDKVEEESQNIQRRPVEGNDTKTMLAKFHRAVPTLIGLNVLGLLGALVWGTPLGWVLLGSAISIAGWFGIYHSQKAREWIGWILSGPDRFVSSKMINHPVAMTLFGSAALVGAYFLATTLGVPIVWVGGIVLVWVTVASWLAEAPLRRILGAAGIASLGTVGLLWLLGPSALMPIFWKAGLFAAITLVTQCVLLSWYQEDAPMEGLLRGIWSAFRFVVKWGLLIAAVYGVGWIVHPFLWKGVLTLPVWGTVLQWVGLKAWLSAAIPALAVPVPFLGTLVPTVGSLIVGLVLLLNLVWQGYLLYNWMKTRPAARREWWSFLLLGIGIPVLVLGSFWVWGIVSAAAIWVYIWVWAVIVWGTSLGMAGLEVLLDALRRPFERADDMEYLHLAPDERVLVNEYNLQPTEADIQRWIEAWKSAYDDKDQKQRQGIKKFPEAPQLDNTLSLDEKTEQIIQALKRLRPAQRRLINLHYWRLQAIKKAQAHPEYRGLSLEDQELLIKYYFHMKYLMTHFDTVFSGDLGGTLMRTFGYGWWTATAEEFIRRMRNDDRVVVIMPALILSLVWAPGDVDDPWKRIKGGQWWLIGWEIFRMLLVSLTVPLGFLSSMVNRTIRSMLIKDSNMLNTIRLRADAGLEGYRDPFIYLIHVMGRWLVGHTFVVMQAYLGRRVVRNARELMAVYRWERKDGSVEAHIERLMNEAEPAWDSNNLDTYRKKMVAAYYAALSGGMNVTFDLGETPTPTGYREETFTRVTRGEGKPDVDPGTDDTRMPPELVSGALAGTVGMRLSEPIFYLPVTLSHGGTRLASEPRKIAFEVGRFLKARGADTGFQILMGRFFPIPNFTRIPKPTQGGPGYKLEWKTESVEDRAFPKLKEDWESVDNPRDRGKETDRRREGIKAAKEMAKRRHERLLKEKFKRQNSNKEPSDDDLRKLNVTAVFQGELGYDAYKDPEGLWYQLRLNFFRWLRDRYLGRDAQGKYSAWRAGLWWLGNLVLAYAVLWLSGSLSFGVGLVVVLWLTSLLYGTLKPLSYLGLGVQDSLLQGMKAHYDSAFLEKAMDGFFEHTPAKDRGDLDLDVEGYKKRLRHGLHIIFQDNVLKDLVRIYPHLMHPEHPIYKWFGFQEADPELVSKIATLLNRPVPRGRWQLRRLVKKEILNRVQRLVGNQEEWQAFRETFTRNTQLELAAIGNKVAGMSYHGSRSWDVLRGGDVNRQFAREGQGPLEKLMQSLKVPAVRGRSWAHISQGVFYGAVRMRSDMKDSANRPLLPIEAYLKQAKSGETVNDFMLRHTHLQPDLEAVTEFFLEESREFAKKLPDRLTFGERVNEYLRLKEQRLGLPEGTFVRLEKKDQAWLNKVYNRLKEKIERDGEIHMSAAKPLPKSVTRLLLRLRWWTIAIGIVGGLAFPWLLAVALAAWVLGWMPVRTAMTSAMRWIQPRFVIAAIRGRTLDPYSDEVILLNVLFGATKDQVIRPLFGGGFAGLRWSALDGLYDSSRWQLAVGPYLFPGSPLFRIPLWERGGSLIHATPVPFLAALLPLEEPPWLSSASGFNRLPTDAWENGLAFAEDTLFGFVNFHRPTLNPTVNALNIHKLNYLFGQQELRKRDQASTRALQLFKGMGMAEAIQHLLDHPMFGQYKSDNADAAKTIQRLFGWDPDTKKASGISIFGMQAFLNDEVATAGARGAGVLSYGYSGFTASNLFGRRVGPFAPGVVGAYWNYRRYAKLDKLMDRNFFKTLRSIQKEHHQDQQNKLDDETSPQALLHGKLVDPWIVLAEARVQEMIKKKKKREGGAQGASSPSQPTQAGMEEVPKPQPSQPKEMPVEAYLPPSNEAAGLEAMKLDDREDAAAATGSTPTVSVFEGHPTSSQAGLEAIETQTSLSTPVQLTTFQPTSNVVEEVRVAVISSEAVDRHPDLREVQGSIHKIHDGGWILVLPERMGDIPDLITPILSETRSVKFHLYQAGLEDVSSQRFVDVIRPFIDSGSFEVVSQQIAPVDLGHLLRRILANLVGLEETAISEEELKKVEELLGLGVQA